MQLEAGGEGKGGEQAKIICIPLEGEGTIEKKGESACRVPKQRWCLDPSLPFYFYFLFFCLGKGGKCFMHLAPRAPCVVISSCSSLINKFWKET